jgi:TPP-dependent pyruvate/acetoin dehydrogenase alpha subunit
MQVVFASAAVAEAVTGNSLFEKMDPERLLGICLAILTSSLMAAGFAFALKAKTQVAYSFTRGYENLMNSLIDKVFDNLLFDNDED